MYLKLFARKLLLFLLLFTGTLVSAQTGSVSGMVTDRIDNDTVPFVTVMILKGNREPIAQTTTDFNGRYQFSNIPAGKYKLSTSYFAFKPFKKKLIVLPDSHLIIDIQLEITDEEPTVIINASKPRISICHYLKSDTEECLINLTSYENI